MTGRNKFKKNRLIINFFAKSLNIFGRKINYSLLIFFRNTTGIIGISIRYILVKNLAKNIGDNVSIQPGVYLFNLQNIDFGNNVSIHPMCYFEGAGGITIGNDVSIAHATTLISTNHTWDDATKPIKYNKEIFEKIIINNDVWIGCGVRVLSGVSIGSRSVIAAGAVVNKNIENNSIVGGVPAKFIKNI
ncbi:MAG: acyltransferase [Lutibacter sp.]